MRNFKKTRLYKVLESSWLCLRFPFLYPRNRYDGKHHRYMLNHILCKLHSKAITEFSINVNVQKANDDTYRHSYFSFLNNQVILKKDLGILTIKNDIDKKEIQLKDIVNLKKFSVIGMEVIFSISGTPLIQIYVKTIDVNDTTNYGSVGNKKVELIADKRYNFRYKVLSWIDKNILDNIFILPNNTELDAMEPGWRKAFGIQMCKDIRKQLWKEGKLFKYRIMQVKEKFGCYDEKTEILTEKGWKYFKDLQSEDKVATLGKDNNIEYHIPHEIMNYDYSGLMYKLVNRGLDILVTPNHNLYVAKGSYFYHKKNNLKVLNPFEFCTPDKYFGKDKRFLKTGKWQGLIPNSEFVIPSWKSIRTFSKSDTSKIRVYQMPEFKCGIHEFLQFLGFYVAEGYANYGDGQGSDIIVSYNPYDEEAIVTKLLSNIKVNFKQAGLGSKRFSNATLAKWLKENCGHLAWNKKVPEFIKSLSPEYIEEFLTYLYLGDGHKSKTSNILTTTSKQLSDDVCELLLKAGYSFSVNTREPHNSINSKIHGKRLTYEISWLKLSEIEIDMSKAKHTKSFVEDWVQYTGKIYCVNVENHIVYVRRNGKGYWCGNSLCWYDAHSSTEIYKIIEKYEKISRNTCIVCGKPATKISNGWICPYCDEHYHNGIETCEEKIDGKWIIK